MFTRLPGMELLGIGVNWALVWVVVWSLKRNAWQGAIAGLGLGLLQDALTSPYPLLENGVINASPTHMLGLVLVGFLTGKFQKDRYFQEDFISVALLTFGMTLLAETVIALQLVLIGDRDFSSIWLAHQQIALCSAILSSLWAPVIYVPMNLFWERFWPNN
ncbi:MAG: rod shape-determining protein MreD [Roseofilum sp. SBFL]|nr:rod shape-determining protein MreD [Roseofilum sp. Belize Diploria]MBP0014779.1 rod shape-determining protein MreD [Roseofilum sp. SID3]MBP0024140.1 rod shape-determining protein MreD [Roseofilum sp. SID2]MBP0034486.1 rod shape-determining protein MreD [Roseofilum sp. Belize BBD 4]MBP0038031.1 rod shape-determining protein MreD [Roseofilum sp. SID1]MBP0042635.1 rod shape-determining protein MreD [Roseofilum sp. SBFL]